MADMALAPLLDYARAARQGEFAKWMAEKRRRLLRTPVAVG
jgi:hypothetical protein